MLNASILRCKPVKDKYMLRNYKGQFIETVQDKICPTCKKTFHPELNRQKFCSRSCVVIAQHKNKQIGIRKDGNETIDKNRGYTRVKNHKHPFAHKDGYVLKHRLVMESHLRRFLKKEEVVHHVDENPRNNNLNNLILFPNQSAHSKHHKSLCQPHQREFKM